MVMAFFIPQFYTNSHCEERQRRGNLLLVQYNCFAAVIAMDGMYAENAGAVFCRNDSG
jgi:hypothetical protein